MASKLSALIAATTEKTTPVDADKLPILDSAATNYFKWIGCGSLKTALASIFPLLSGKSGGQTLIGGTAVTDKLVLQGTSGNGTSSATALEVKVGNAGATSALAIANDGTLNIAGNFGVGATTVSAKAHVVSTTEQQRLGYDTSNYVAYTVSSVGRLAEAVTAAGGSTTFYRSTDGAFWSETIGQTAGNARGAGAIDLQTVRGAATRVASGAQSLSIGANNTASGIQSVAIGSGNTASNTCSISMGLSCISVGSGTLSAGNNCIASGYASVALGMYSNNSIFCSESIGGGAASGQHQMGRIPVGIATTDATPTILNLNASASNRPTIPAKAAWLFRCHIIAHTSTTTYRVAAWEITGVIARDGSSNTRIVGTPTITEIANESTWIATAPTVTADDTNEALAITVTGVAATTIRWTGGVYYTQALAA